MRLRAIAALHSLRDRRLFAIGAALCLASGCKDDGKRFVLIVNPGNRPPITFPTPTPTPRPTPPAGVVTVAFSFDRDADGWVPVFADYAADGAAIVMPDARVEALPRDLGTGRGYRLSSAGNDGTLFSGLWRPVTGLRPYTSYRIDATVTLASNLAPGCMGAFRRAGEDQVVKIGATSVVPEPASTGTRRLPLDKGAPAGSGRDMAAVGDLTIPALIRCQTGNLFQRKTVSTQERGPVVATDSIGRLWLVAGVDSQYPGAAAFYVLGGRYTLTPLR